MAAEVEQLSAALSEERRLRSEEAAGWRTQLELAEERAVELSGQLTAANEVDALSVVG